MTAWRALVSEMQSSPSIFGARFCNSKQHSTVWQHWELGQKPPGTICFSLDHFSGQEPFCAEGSWSKTEAQAADS